jgi:LPS-assembly protein
MAGLMIAFTHPLRPALALFLLSTLLAVATAAEPASDCTEAGSAVAAPAAEASAGTDHAIHWSACHMRIAANGDTDLSGDVTVKVAGRDMHCDHLSYQALNQELTLDGAVRYQDAALKVTGDGGRYLAPSAQISHARFELLQHPGRGEAESISTANGDVIELDRVVYTTCPKGVADWELRSRRMRLNTRTLRGIGYNTRVDFKGLPVLYLPVISFPLSSARQSGFLFPTIGSSSGSGATVSIPWYWNIAPNQDLTATPTIYTSRGVGLGGDYRYLTASGKGELQGDFLPDDKVLLANGQRPRLDRGLMRLNASQGLGAGWRLDVEAARVSDTQYFQDFTQGGTQSTSIVFLPRDLRVGLRSDVWQLRAQLLDFPNLDETLSSADRPYAELPRLTAAAHWLGTSGLGSRLDSELVDFTRHDGTTGWRGHAAPGLSFDYTTPGFYLRPSADMDFTAYSLAAAPTVNATPNRTLPILAVDTALQLERLSPGGRDRLMTLEPRLFYVYIPYRNQDELPVFDSGVPDPNFVSLFSANRYAGFDRIGDANEVTVGLTSRMLQASSGRQYLSATLGQTLRFATPRVTLPGETPGTTRGSDVIANIDLTAYRNWTFHYDLAWNPTQSQPEKSLISVQYRLSGVQVINVGYRYTRGSVAQADASIAWPVSRRWDLYGRSVYSFLGNSVGTPTSTADLSTQRGPIENFMGFQYRGNCWGVRVVVHDSVISRAVQPSPTVAPVRVATRDTGWYLQLELKGLSNVGSAADAFLKGSIQGYSPATTDR